jgi:ABC-type transport system involved in cytochrome c biogenesis permease subunit
LPLLVMVFAFYLFFFAILILRIRNEILVREKNADWVKRWLEVR